MNSDGLASPVRRAWLSKWVLCVAAILVSTMAVLLLASQCHNSVDEANIKATLPPGSTVAEIVAYLHSHGIDYDSRVHSANEFSRLTQSGIPPDTKVFAAIVRDTGGFFLVKEDTQIFFVLDQNEKLMGYLFQEGYTAP